MRLVPFVALCALASTASPSLLRADEAPPPPAAPAPRPAPAPAPEGPAAPRPAIASAYLKGLLGTWDLAIHGPAGDSKGTSTFALGLGGTAVVEQMSDDHGFAGLGVHYVTADGKGLKTWWFDSMGQGDCWPLEGTLSDAGFDLEGEGMGGAKATIALHRDGDGHRYEMKNGAQTIVTIAYRKAAPAIPARVAREKGPASALVDAILGDWTIDGVTVVEAQKLEAHHVGRSTFRLAVGGAYLAQDYEVESSFEHSFGLGVSSLSADGKSLRMWWFSNAFDAPIVFAGKVEGSSFDIKTPKTPFGPMTSTWTAKDGGFVNVGTVELPSGPIVVTETYARKR